MVTRTSSSRTLALLALLCALLALGARPAHAAPGNLDPSFGGDGRVVASFKTFYEEVADLAIQPDGKVVAVGGADFIARYNTNGSPDISFGDSGSANTSVGGANMFAKAVRVQSGGKLLVGGMVFSNGSWTSRSRGATRTAARTWASEPTVVSRSRSAAPTTRPRPWLSPPTAR